MAPYVSQTSRTQLNALQVVVVGAGLGGLSCAIACRRAKPPIAVTVIERAPEILAIGAGIHIPPNACRVMNHYGLVPKLKNAGGYLVQDFTLRRYQNGAVISEKPMGARMEREYGAEWIAIHRGDYQNVLLQEASELGVTMMTNAEVVGVEDDRSSWQQVVSLRDGRQLNADVVVGADGLWSSLREYVLGRPFSPEETGDLAYRGTFTREQLLAFKNEKIDKLMEASNIQVWLGPNRHAVFYPLRNHTEYNLVLLCADDIPEGVRTLDGTAEEMAAGFEGWDPSLNMIISCLKTALKWKLLHFKELDKWTRGPVALLGDASHPTLPYQGQGAAMAVEDGAILGLLLDKLQSQRISAHAEQRHEQLTSLLRLYEDMRKERTKVNVAGAVLTRQFYHFEDGKGQRARDDELAQMPASKWQGSSKWNWADARYQKSLLGFDVLADAVQRFDEWYTDKGRGVNQASL